MEPLIALQEADRSAAYSDQDKAEVLMRAKYGGMKPKAKLIPKVTFAELLWGE